MKIKTDTLRKLIGESIKKHFLNEYGNTWDYPGDSDFRSNAPWNQSDPEYETEQYEEVFPSIPFILLMVDEDYDSSTPEILGQIKKMLINYGCPDKIKVIIEETKEMLGWEEPDEDGYSSKKYGEPEINTEVVFVDENGNLIDVKEWFSNLASDNKQLSDILIHAYVMYKEILSDSYGNLTELKQKIKNYL